MPGLAGVAAAFPGRPASADVSAMAAALQQQPRLIEENAGDPGDRWAAARVHLGHFRSASQIRSEGPVRVLFHGELTNEAELRAIAEGDDARDASGSSLIPSLYRRFGPAFVSRLRGTFCDQHETDVPTVDRHPRGFSQGALCERVPDGNRHRRCRLVPRGIRGRTA